MAQTKLSYEVELIDKCTAILPVPLTLPIEGAKQRPPAPTIWPPLATKAKFNRDLLFLNSTTGSELQWPNLITRVVST